MWLKIHFLSLCPTLDTHNFSEIVCAFQFCECENVFSIIFFFFQDQPRLLRDILSSHFLSYSFSSLPPPSSYITLLTQATHFPSLHSTARRHIFSLSELHSPPMGELWFRMSRRREKTVLLHHRKKKLNFFPGFENFSFSSLERGGRIYGPNVWLYALVCELNPRLSCCMWVRVQSVFFLFVKLFFSQSSLSFCSAARTTHSSSSVHTRNWTGDTNYPSQLPLFTSLM